MSNLVKFVPAPSLLPLEKDALIAHQNPRIKEVGKADMAAPIGVALTKAIMVMGSRVKVDFEIMLDEVLHDLKRNCTTFTVEEVCLAIDLGSKGYLGDEFVHVHTRAVIKWLWLFNDKYKREAIHKQHKHEEQLAKQAELANKEKEEKEFEANIQKLYNAFPKGFKTRNKGSLAACYRHMDKKGLVNLTVKQKKDIYDRILKIKDYVHWKPKGLLEITAKELSEYRALYLVFKEKKKQGVTKLF